MNGDLSKSEREALKAIYRHTKNGTEAHTGDLAETLGVTPGTVTATVKRLADRGLVDHRPYHGVTFTDDGRRQAVAAIRRHRIVERFLADMLAYSWSEADRLAPTFEHELPHEVEQRMFETLGRPTTCPHGFPIPDAEQDSIPEMPRLYELEQGDIAEVALPSSTDGEIVAFLDELGVPPGRPHRGAREAPVRRPDRGARRRRGPHPRRPRRPPHLRAHRPRRRRPGQRHELGDRPPIAADHRRRPGTARRRPRRAHARLTAARRDRPRPTRPAAADRRPGRAPTAADRARAAGAAVRRRSVSRAVGQMRLDVALAGADPHDAVDGDGPDLAVADLAGAGGVGDACR